jgi:hypothetical protein
MSRSDIDTVDRVRITGLEIAQGIATSAMQSFRELSNIWQPSEVQANQWIKILIQVKVSSVSAKQKMRVNKTLARTSLKRHPRKPECINLSRMGELIAQGCDSESA